MSVPAKDDKRIAVYEILSAEARKIADTFYEEMTQKPEAAPFLESDLVDKRLRPAMMNWIEDVFAPGTESQEEHFRRRQAMVGEVHARVNVPMKLVFEGMAVLKRECFRRLQISPMDRNDLVDAILYVNDRLDLSMSLINESFLSDVLSNERNDQSLRLHMISHHLAIECERLRSGLLDWLRRNLLALYDDKQKEALASQNIEESELGLWVTHKADLLFPDIAETTQLRSQLRAIDASMTEVRQERVHGMTDAFRAAVSRLDNLVSHTVWLLSTLVDHALEVERARDPLTRVLNRRYLPSIIQREIKVSIRGNIPFAILLVDIDRFKQINDRLGHDAGDRVLAEFAEVLVSLVRANDFVFRYGGEEFLVLMGHATGHAALDLAERIRSAVGTRRFNAGHHEEVDVTASIGIALHEGHPDYKLVIQRADAALMEAKKSGRNRCEVAQFPDAAERSRR